MEKPYLVGNMLKILVLLITILFSLSCSGDGINEDENFPSNLQRVVVDTFYLMDEYDFMSGNISSFKQISSDNYIFLDFSQRRLFHLDKENQKISQISKHGEGPGEYRTPSSFQPLSKNSIAFTDISNTSLKKVDLKGRLISQLNHGLGGGKKFLIENNEIFVLGSLTDPLSDYNQLTIFDNQGNLIDELFPVKPEYEYLLRNLGMGDITQFNDYIVFTNSIEPALYIYNPNSGEIKETNPFSDEVVSTNNPDILNSYNLHDLRLAFTNDLFSFHKLGSIEVDGNNLLAIILRKGSKFVMYLLDDDFNIKYKYIPTYGILDIQDKYIFESDVSDGSGKIEKVKISFNNKDVG